jgi:hypothetical protein
MLRTVLPGDAHVVTGWDRRLGGGDDAVAGQVELEQRRPV